MNVHEANRGMTQPCRDEQLAGKSKADAHTLLNKERELFQKSFKLFDNELAAQSKAKQEQKKLFELKSMGNAAKTQELSDTDDSALYPHNNNDKAASSSLHASANHAAEKAKRPLWGSRKWPSYYDNALAAKSAFSVDAPKKQAKQADAHLDSGDDDKAIDGKGRTTQRCSMDNPCLDKSRVPHAPKTANSQRTVMQPHEYMAGHDPAKYYTQAEVARQQQLQEQEQQQHAGPVREAHGYEKRGRIQQMWEEIPKHPSLKVGSLQVVCVCVCVCVRVYACVCMCSYGRRFLQSVPL
jgi:hypothetical protein